MCVLTWLTSAEIISYEQSPDKACSVVVTGNNVAMQRFSDGQQSGHARQH